MVEDWPKDTEARIMVCARAVEETARDNGWEKPTWENFPGKMAMVVTEIVEAHAYLEDDSSLGEELADTAIRMLAILESVFPGWTVRLPVITSMDTYNFQSLESLLWPVLKRIGQAIEFWRHDHTTDAQISIEFALKEVFRVSMKLGIDLVAEIIRKDNINKGRGHLHGKVNALG